MQSNEYHVFQERIQDQQHSPEQLDRNKHDEIEQHGGHQQHQQLAQE